MQKWSLFSKASLPWFFSVIALLGLIFAILGPFGTHVALSFFLRVAYWVILLATAAACVGVIHRFASNRRERWDLRWMLLVEALSFTLMFSPLTWVISGFFSQEILGLDVFFLILGNVLALACISAALTYVFTQEPELVQMVTRPRLHDRLPETATGQIVRLTVNDHYVGIFLDDGTDHRVLMRLADAVREMDDVSGFYTHRSHWVCHAHVKGRLREGQRDYLSLSDGARVPISKTYQQDVAAAGFA